MPRPESKIDHLHDRRPRGARARGRDARRRAPSTATSRSRSSVTSPSSAQPVGACRMCLVEIEGIPQAPDRRARRRSRTAWSSTRRPTACKAAQESVVEFLLVNHPLDCPVCDKGGECPLQDITFGWGGGNSRFIEPKRHFNKPLELSPLIAIDRERCILCYRCVRFSQEVAEDYQLVLLERGAALVRRHVRRPSLRRAVQRQHHRAVPRRRADLAALPLPRPPVGHRAGAARSARSARRSATSPSPSATSASCACSSRENDEVDDGWLCDKGRFAYQADPRRRAHHRSRSCATAASCARSRGSARSRPPRACCCARAGGRVGAPRGRRHDQRGGLPARSACCARRSARPHLDSRAGTARCRAGSPRARRARAAGDGPRPRVRPPRPRARLPSRSTTRRSSTCASARACAATARSSPSPRRARLARPQRRAVAPLRAGRRRGVRCTRSPPRSPAATSTRLRRRRRRRGRTSALADALHGAGEDVVILYGERLLAGPGADAARALLASPTRLELAAHDGAGLLEIPAATQRPRPARGRRAARRRPGPRRASDGRGLARRRSPTALAAGELTALYLLGVDPLRRPARAARRLGASRSTGLARRRPRRRCLTDGVARARRRRLPARSPTPRRRARSPTPTAASQRAAPGDRPPRATSAGLVGPRRARAARRRSTSTCYTARQASDAAVRRRPFYAGLTLDDDRRHAACAGPSASRRRAARAATPARRARRPGRRARAPTARCASARSARCGAAPRSRRRRRCAFLAPRADGRALARRRRAPRRHRRPERRARRRRRRASAAIAALRHAVPGRHRRSLSRRPGGGADELADGRPSRCAPHDARPRRRSTYVEPWWVQIIKAVVIFARRPPARPDRAARRAQAASAASSAATGPTASGPSARCSRWPTSSSCSARSSSARAASIGFLFALAPAISVITAVADVRDHPVRRHRRHLRHAGRPLRDRRRRSARSTSSPSARSPSTA